MNEISSKNATAQFRPCCSDAARDLGPAAPVFQADLALFLTQADAAAPAFELPVFERNRVIAHHEAAHVAVALACTGTVSEVTIDRGVYLADAKVPDAASWRIYIAFTLAGDIAGRWTNRWTIPIAPADLAWTLKAVRSCGGGRCDICQAVRTATVGLRHPPDDEIVAELRSIEAATTAFVQAPTNWTFIRRLADLLIQLGTVTGVEISAEFGAYAFDLSALNSLS